MFWGYSAPDRKFGAPDMACSGLKLNESAAATDGSNFFCCPGPSMASGGADPSVAISDRMMRHPLFGGADPNSCTTTSI